MKAFIVLTLFASLALSSCTSIGTNRESTIVLQAVGTGAATGAGVGAIIGNQRGKAGEGAIIGAAIGGLAGAIVADQQIKNLRNVTLRNDRFAQLIGEANRYNGSVEAYNSRSELRLAQLQSEAVEKRTRLAAAEVANLKRSQVNIDGVLVTRNDISNALSSSQRGVYSKEVEELRSERRRLSKLINRFEKMQRDGASAGERIAVGR